MKLFILSLFLPGIGFSQESWNTLGGDAGNISFSIGQPFTANYAFGNTIFFEGVQIPTINPNLKTPVLEENVLSLFPNPVNTVLVVKSDVNFQIRCIRDISGRIIYQFNEDQGLISEINVSLLSTGTYFLEILSQGSIQAIPFIKN